MRRLHLSILAALVLLLASVGTAGADHRNGEDHGPPGDPPCEQGQAGLHNPNCLLDDGLGGGLFGPPGDPPCERGQAGEHNPNCPDDDDVDNGEGACPEGALLDQDVAGVAYVCVILLPDAETAECPEGSIGPIPLSADPVVNACVTVVPE